MRIRIYFEPRDLWVGVYWNVERTSFDNSRVRCREWSVYICLLPCFPIRLRWLHGYKMDDAGNEIPLEN